MSGNLVYTFFLLILSTCVFSQDHGEESFTAIRAKYENLKKGDSSAMPYVRNMILKAETEKNYEKLCLAYKDAVYFSPLVRDKMFYADRTISAALLSKDHELISDAYLGKGIIYYFNQRKFQMALDQYLKANQYASKTNNEYLKKKVVYHMGVVRSYLGYYEKALKDFNSCIAYYEKKSKEPVHENLKYNYCKGYLNSLHQMVISHRNLNHRAVADSLINIGLAATENKPQYILERGYFLKCRGIIHFQNGDYNSAIFYLKKSLVILDSQNDFTWAAIIHLYLGKIYLKSNHVQMGISQLTMVDSIYQQHQFLLPEATEGYALLINYYKKENNQKKQLYFTDQSLLAKDHIRDDFSYLSAKIYEEFEIAGLVKEKTLLERSIRNQHYLIEFIFIISIFLVGLLTWKYIRERNLKKRYLDLLQKLETLPQQTVVVKEKAVNSPASKNNLSDDLVEQLTVRIKVWEDKEQFLEAGTVVKLAAKMKTNSNYLAQFIHEYKGATFSQYLTQLRIHYITHKLHSDPKYLKYTIKGLAEICGIASRNNFSDLFLEINGIRPGDFIKMKLKDNKREQ